MLDRRDVLRHAIMIGLAIGGMGIAGCECASSPSVARDAEVDAEPDAEHGEDASSSCLGPRPRALAIRAEGECELGIVEGLLLEPIREAPEVDGVALSIDVCAEVDRDCPCTLVVEGVGVAIASRTLLDRGPVRIEASPTRIAVVGTHSGGEAGAYEDLLGLYAESGPLDGELSISGISIASIDACTETDGECVRRRHDAIVTIDERAAGWDDWTDGGSVRLVEGDMRAVEGTFASARLVMARDEACDGTDPPPTGAWAIAWLYPPAP